MDITAEQLHQAYTEAVTEGMKRYTHWAEFAEPTQWDDLADFYHDGWRAVALLAERQRATVDNAALGELRERWELCCTAVNDSSRMDEAYYLAAHEGDVAAEYIHMLEDERDGIEAALIAVIDDMREADWHHLSATLNQQVSDALNDKTDKTRRWREFVARGDHDGSDALP